MPRVRCASFQAAIISCGRRVRVKATTSEFRSTRLRVHLSCGQDGLGTAPSREPSRAYVSTFSCHSSGRISEPRRIIASRYLPSWSRNIRASPPCSACGSAMAGLTDIAANMVLRAMRWAGKEICSRLKVGDGRGRLLALLDDRKSETRCHARHEGALWMGRLPYPLRRKSPHPPPGRFAKPGWYHCRLNEVGCRPYH